MEPIAQTPGTSAAASRARPARRQRNARGQGARLTEEIVSGAVALIEAAGTDEAVTLRAVAREIGIAAPSIYAHFADRDAIITAVVQRIFEELTEAVEAGMASADQDPVSRLLAGCDAYVSFGLDHPARYGALFSERRMAAREHCEPPGTGPARTGPDGKPVLEVGAETFALLVRAIEDCAEAGVSASTDPFSDATAVWVAMHGTVSLRRAEPWFPWPDPDQLIRGYVLSLARVTASAPRG
ncbi:MAG TPA: TetR/AcrR family transcriptional regulator [Streptosporangiaceae bacterium]